MTTSPDRAAHAYVGAFVEELVRAGMRHVCIAPGSRSTPLALTIAAHSGLRTWIHLDERSAGFFALGMARMLGEPVALLCTSGSAAANFYPAVVEARAARVPLVVLTADRPPELRDAGAAQTMDQNRLYGTHAKWFVDVALPEATPELLRYSRTLACRAVALAKAQPAGPVHLNFPFREPLVPVAGPVPHDMSPADSLAWHGRPDGEPWVTVTDAPGVPDDASVDRIAEKLLAARRPLLVCGPQHDAALAEPFVALARALGAPLLADPLSQLRWGGHDRSAVIDRYDAALRHEATAVELAPDLVLRIGALPTSKVLLQFLQRHGSARFIVVDAAGWPEPTLQAAEMVHADPAALCQRLAEHITRVGTGGKNGEDGAWMSQWRRLDDAAFAELTRFSRAVAEPFEGQALAEIAEAMPDRGTLVVSSSMPVRDLDAFAEGDNRHLRVLANRGVNGIDGVVSTALGAAAAGGDASGPTVLVIGDIAFYHDMNGLLAAKLHALDATIVVINNDGGGIFSFLPQASQPEHFEQLFGTPHGLTFAAVAELYGATYSLAHGMAELRSGVSAGIEGRGLHIVELRTDRARNVTLHREAWAAVAAALDAR